MFNASPIMRTTFAGDAGNVRLLHARGGDVNRKMFLLGAFPTSPLGLAIRFGEVDMMKSPRASRCTMATSTDTRRCSTLRR